MLSTPSRSPFLMSCNGSSTPLPTPHSGLFLHTLWLFLVNASLVTFTTSLGVISVACSLLGCRYRPWFYTTRPGCTLQLCTYSLDVFQMAPYSLCSALLLTRVLGSTLHNYTPSVWLEPIYLEVGQKVLLCPYSECRRKQHFISILFSCCWIQVHFWHS